MQITPAFSEVTGIKTASLHKLLFWSLIFHVLALVTFWSEQPDAPLLAGKAVAGKQHKENMLSVALAPNTSPANTEPVATKDIQPQTKASPETRHKESNRHDIPASKSNMQAVVRKPATADSPHVATIKPEPAREKEPFTTFQQAKRDTTYSNHPLTSNKQLSEISTEAAEQLQASLGEKLSEYFHYPRLARKNGWQGQVKLRLRIEGSGQLSNIRVYKSSGYPSLDNAALNSLQEIAYLPDARDWLQGMHYDIVVPVEYHLIGS